MNGESGVAHRLSPAYRVDVRAAWAAHFRRLRLWRPSMSPRRVIWVNSPVWDPLDYHFPFDVLASDWLDAFVGLKRYVQKRLVRDGGGVPQGQGIREEILRVFDARRREGLWTSTERCAKDLIIDEQCGCMERSAVAPVGDPSLGWTFFGAATTGRIVVEAAALWEAIRPGDPGNVFLPLVATLRHAPVALVMHEAVICVKPPTFIQVDAAGRLHHDSGPAVVWGGHRYHYWHGVNVPREVVEAPDTLTGERILREGNLEVRRVMIERAGWERALRGAVRLHEEPGRVLWRAEAPGQEPFVAVQVTDPSTGRQYILQVPPQVRTCHEAVAWTFGMSAADYAPLQET